MGWRDLGCVGIGPASCSWPCMPSCSWSRRLEQAGTLSQLLGLLARARPQADRGTLASVAYPILDVRGALRRSGLREEAPAGDVTPEPRLN
jgi:hypothetical protein